MPTKCIQVNEKFNINLFLLAVFDYVNNRMNLHIPYHILKTLSLYFHHLYYIYIYILQANFFWNMFRVYKKPDENEEKN